MTKIEAGKYYRDRQGLIWGPMERREDMNLYVWTAPPATPAERPIVWTEDGRYFASRNDSPKDLTREFKVEHDPSPRLKITDIEDHGPIMPPGSISYVEPREPRVKPGYDPLADVLQMALNQAQSGKGATRHTDKPLPWLEQPIMEIGRMIGSAGPAFQVIKKTQEAQRMVARGQYQSAIAELLGAINYAAAVVLLIQEIETEGLFDTTAQAAE